MVESLDDRDRAAGWQPVLPPWSTVESGAPRRIGVEIEMIGPTVEEVGETLREVLNGTLESVSRYECIVHGDEAGPWRVELDFAYLKEKGREQADGEEPTSLISELAEGVVRTGAEAIVPIEVVSPPLPVPRLAGVEALVRELRLLGARGTKAGPVYAFGMQFNPEMPRCDAGTVLRYLRAFLCLHDWLVRESAVDMTRKLTRYMAPFPADYVRRVVGPAYDPDLATLIDDYLEANPTRNRALDMLPLFTELDEPRVRRVVSDPLVKARPALHYRLPNSEIDDPEWGIHVAWSDWLQVEFLAHDEVRLGRVCQAYAAFLDRSLGTLLGDWAAEIEPWLHEIPGP